jgi:hypothetical protein
MDKAYDLKALGLKLKGKGLPVLEEAAEAAAGQCYLALKEWLQESAVLSENKIDDVVMPFIGQLDSMILPLIDKIDKKEG